MTSMDTYRQLQHLLRQRVQESAARLIRTGTTVVVTYGGGPANQYGLASSGDAIVAELAARGVPAVQIPANGPRGLQQLADLEPGRVMVWITDPYRYATVPDGRVVRSDLRHDLQAIDLTVVSQSLACSAATLFKDETIEEAKAVGLRTIPGVRITQGNGEVDQALQLLATSGPVIAKPVDGDEGQGVSLVDSPRQLLAAISAIHDRPSDALVEIYTPGTEVGVPVLALGPDAMVALPAVEAFAEALIIDHQVKTTPGALQLFCPPRHIDSPVLDQLAELAVRLASRLGARALLRADFIVDHDGTAWFLEANSFPGLSPTGLLMASLTKLGLSRGDLALLVISGSDMR